MSTTTTTTTTETARKTRSQGSGEGMDIDGAQSQPGLFKRWVNVENELVDYGSYHHNTVNKVIHFIFIPSILWSLVLMLSNIRLTNDPVVVLAPHMAIQPTVGLVFVAVYQFIYLCLDPIAGMAIMPTMALIYTTAQYVNAFPPSWLPFQTAGHPNAIPAALTFFTLSWIAQFVGHGVWEKRAPRLLDNPVQPLITAPFFEHMHVMFALLNYRPDLQKRVKARVEANVKAFHGKRA